MGKINSRISQVRQQKLGITHYRWRTSRDERVRSTYRGREGDIIAWDDPPPDGHAGQPIRCRCTAEPYIDHLVDPDAPTPEEAVKIQDQQKREKSKLFKQPSGNFTIYDPAYPRVDPDISTPVRKAMVDLEKKIRSDALETGAFFDSDGKISLKRQGQPDRVAYTIGELRKNRGRAFTHNHPNGMSFSVADLEIAAEYQFAELRAVGPNYTHILTAPNGWPEAEELTRYADQSLQTVADEVRDQVRVGEVSSAVQSQEASHRHIEKVAKKFGLVYIREAS